MTNAPATLTDDQLWRWACKHRVIISLSTQDNDAVARMYFETPRGKATLKLVLCEESKANAAEQVLRSLAHARGLSRDCK